VSHNIVHGLVPSRRSPRLKACRRHSDVRGPETGYWPATVHLPKVRNFSEKNVSIVVESEEKKECERSAFLGGGCSRL